MQADGKCRIGADDPADRGHVKRMGAPISSSPFPGQWGRRLRGLERAWTLSRRWTIKVDVGRAEPILEYVGGHACWGRERKLDAQILFSSARECCGASAVGRVVIWCRCACTDHSFRLCAVELQPDPPG